MIIQIKLCGEGSTTMSNKFGKFLLAGAAIGSALGTTYYLLRKKKNTTKPTEEYEDEDYDDFGAEFEEDLEPTPQPQKEPTPVTKTTI